MSKQALKNVTLEVSVLQAGGQMGKRLVEVEMVSGTEGLFAVRRVDEDSEVSTHGFDAGQMGEVWSLLHAPTGFGLAEMPTRNEAVYVGRQLHGLGSIPWNQTDPLALAKAMPPPVRQWLRLLAVAAAAGVPAMLLKGVADFVRDMGEAVPPQRE